MEYNDILATLVIQMLVAGFVWIWWAGIYQVREKQDPGGWGGIVIGFLGVMIFSYALLNSQGWIGYSLMVGLPVVLSIPAYWVYRAKKKARVFIGATMAIGIAFLILVVVVWYVVVPGGLLGYGGLAAGALVGYLCVLLLWRYTRQPSSVEPRRRSAGWQATIGAALGVTVGAAILRGAVRVLGPDFATATLAFLGGWLGFSVMGATILQLLRKSGNKIED